jgi:hypothetical protein
MSDEDIINLVRDNYKPEEEKEDNLNQCIDEKVDEPITIKNAKKCVNDLLKFITINNLNIETVNIYDSLIVLSEQLQILSLDKKKQSKIIDYVGK